MKKQPKPKKGDSVEYIDMSKLFGIVKKIVNDNEVEVNWEEGLSIEKITNLALVSRRNNYASI